MAEAQRLLPYKDSPPPCPEEGDVDDSGAVNIAYVTYLVEYIFFGGPAPPPCP